MQGGNLSHTLDFVNGVGSGFFIPEKPEYVYFFS